jgi:hypothetical protein
MVRWVSGVPLVVLQDKKSDFVDFVESTSEWQSEAASEVKKGRSRVPARPAGASPVDGGSRRRRLPILDSDSWIWPALDSSILARGGSSQG